jgi:hypothetical protein
MTRIVITVIFAILTLLVGYDFLLACLNSRSSAIWLGWIVVGVVILAEYKLIRSLFRKN